MLGAARAQKLEGVIGKRRNSTYQAGQRSGSWVKYRLNSGQELVVGGYVPGTHGLDSIIVGYYRGKDLIYVGRVRNGFVPASRRQVFQKLRLLHIQGRPFVNLPETHKGRWGDGLTAKDMEKCEGESFPVRSTAKRKLKQIDFQFDGKDLRGLEQNPDTKSRWAAMARNGKKVMQFLEGGRYVAVVADGKVHLYAPKT